MASSRINLPGAIGLPPSMKEPGKRVDFKSTTENQTDFDFLIETKATRVGWARAVPCSCKGYNEQTDQHDPKCPTCNGLGFRFFKPTGYVVDSALIGELTDDQQLLIDRTNAVVIRGLLTSLTTQPDIFSALGEWALGTAMLTPRAANLLGYYDRIIDLDGKRPHSEVLECDGTTTTKLRYPAMEINFLGTITQTFELKKDYKLVAGAIEWVSGKQPKKGTRVSAHYLHRPVWVVWEHTKLARRSLTKYKRKQTKTPTGDILELPGQVLVRLEHLPLDPS